MEKGQVSPGRGASSSARSGLLAEPAVAKKVEVTRIQVNTSELNQIKPN
jgi:hypothetical protein